MDISISDNEYFRVKKLLLSENTVVEETLTGYQKVSEGWHIKPRKLSEHLIYYICRNHAAGIVAGKHISLEPGTLLWLLPQTPHTFFCATGKKPPKLYHFRFKLHNHSLSRPENRYFAAAGMNDSLNMVCMYYQDRQISPPDINCRVKSILFLLLSDMGRRLSSGLSGNYAHGFNRQAIERIIEYCRKHIKERPSPKDLAHEIRLSEDYFSRLFKRTFGISPRRWLVKNRIMAIAEDLQNSEKSISEIAYEYGYSDIFFFSRQFKQITGKSPRHSITKY